jgi:hypothetical protein
MQPMNGVATWLLTLAAAAAWAGAAAAQDTGGHFSAGGLLFGDLFHVPSHHSAAGEGATGLVLRRAYLTFNAGAGPNWSGRLRFETNQSGRFEEYSFDTKVKDLYIGRELGRHRLLLGLQPTLTYDVIESIWGKRYLLRTPLDLQGVASRDTGVSLKGPLNATGTLSYRVMAGLGVEFGADSDGQDKWMAALSWEPAPNWLVDLYVDTRRRSGPSDRSTWQLFTGYQAEGLRWGLQYSDQDREDDPPLELASMFLVKRIGATTNLIGRIDYLFEPSPKGDGISYLPMDPSARATLFIAGAEFRVTPHVVLTPNLVSIRYGRNEQGGRPGNDLHLRVTLFVDFE